ncbi:MAG TPA: SAM-dependent methyltransferase [Puia sp.]|nr:SAM-dependent methyltransferase [Puia sp.]
MSPRGTVYLIPSYLDEYSLDPLPAYIASAARECQVFFVENERFARRYLRRISKEIVIDDLEWFAIHKAETEQTAAFRQKISEGKTIGIISDAGCPGIADPGQLLIRVAHQIGAVVRPLAGPSSVFLALMASGMNGQYFQFVGYLPIDQAKRVQAIKNLEKESRKNNATQIFIETPYRNNQLVDTLVKTCEPSTRLCIAAGLTSQAESIRTKTIGEWKSDMPDLHKKQVVYCLCAQ